MIKHLTDKILPRRTIWDAQISNTSRLILAYHRVIPVEVTRNEMVQKCMWISPDSLEEQIKWMMRVGEVVGIERILDYKRENTRPLFALTFDDGWKDNYVHAFPILKKYGITAAIFIVTSAVNTGKLFWPEEILQKTGSALKNNKERDIRKFINSRLGVLNPWKYAAGAYDLADYFLEYLKEMNSDEREECIKSYYSSIGIDPNEIRGYVLNWDEILEMDKYGIRFGSHTHNHAILQYCNDETILDELLTSKKIIKDKLKKPVKMFCYPNARFNHANARLLRKAGYEFGFKLHNEILSHRYSNYFIPRILMNEANSFKLLNLRIENKNKCPEKSYHFLSVQVRTG